MPAGGAELRSAPLTHCTHKRSSSIRCLPLDGRVGGDVCCAVAEATITMARAPERTYATEAERLHAERLRAERREADREAAGLFHRQMAEFDLAARGLLDLAGGEYLSIQTDDEGNPFAVIARSDTVG